MSDEAHIDRYLQEIIEKDRFREANLHSTYLRNFQRHDRGDRVSLILSGIARDSIQRERVEAVLVDPEYALIDVKYVEGELDWKGRQIGLATLSEYPKSDILSVQPHFVAGNQAVAYFLPEDMNKHDTRRTVLEKHVRLLALKYVKLSVDGMPIFDFTDGKPASD